MTLILMRFSVDIQKKSVETMKSIATIVLLLAGAVFGDIAGECDMVGFYQELGCTAVPNTENSSNCPVAFNCPNHYSDASKCYYKGVAYDDETKIPQALVDHSCSLDCVCQVGYFGPMFQCAAVDCMESFRWSGYQQNCIYTRKLDSCCSSGSICGEEAIAKLKTCVVDGTTYREGQSFYPKNTHKMCICAAHWNGSTEDRRYCKDLNCGIEIHSQDKLRRKCAPVFISSRRSCPIYFKCPSTSTAVIRNTQRNVGAQCSFGNLTLSVGDEVTVDDQCTTCKCSVPPFVSCIKETNCDY